MCFFLRFFPSEFSISLEESFDYENFSFFDIIFPETKLLPGFSCCFSSASRVQPGSRWDPPGPPHP